MGNFINKHFLKSKCIKVLYFNESKKQETHYLIPDGSTVTLDGKSFTLDKDNFTIDKKSFITYVFSHKRLEPISPDKYMPLDPESISPADLNVALNSKVASEILNAVKQKVDINVILMGLGVLMIIGFGLLWYTTKEQNDFLRLQIQEMLDKLTAGGL